MVAEAVREAVALEPRVAVSAEGEGARESLLVPVTRPVSRPNSHARLNAAIALLTLADGVLESFLYDDFSLVGFSLMFVAPFVWFAWVLRAAVPSEAARWTRISGVTCLALGATCIASGVSALTKTPMDVACVAMSAAFLAVFGFAGVRQLNSGRE